MNIPKRRRQHSRLQTVLGGFLALAVVAAACTEHPTSPRTSIDPDLHEASFSTSTSSTVGGPVILMGVDSEFGGATSDHGPQENWATLVEDGILANVTKSGAGILVIGETGPNVTAYWNDVGSRVGQPVTYVEGATNIAAVDFSPFLMIGVASSECELPPLLLPGQGLSNEENQALIGRAADVAAFVNSGGGLLGFTQATRNPSDCPFDDPWGYIGQIGDFETITGLCYNTIVPTTEGEAVGVTHPEMSFTCWHDTFTSGPDFLSVLAWRSGFEGPLENLTADEIPEGAQAAALGGVQVVLVPPETGTQACSPGFWSNDGLRNSSWTGTGWDPDDPVTDMFSAAATYPELADRTLLESLEGGGGRGAVGAARILLRAAVAAVLNEESFGAAYPATSVADLQDQVNAALASEDRDQMLELATLLDWYNNNYEVDADGNLVLDGEGNPVVIGDCPLESESD